MTNKGQYVIEYLFGDHSDRCMKFIDYSNILIQKWNDDACLMRELRLFIDNNNLVAISQQDCTKSYKFIELAIVENSNIVYDNCELLWKTIKKNVAYSYCILDVYIDDDLDVHLIEINPTHSWTGAGSSLFEWNNDKPINKQFRLLV